MCERNVFHDGNSGISGGAFDDGSNCAFALDGDFGERSFANLIVNSDGEVGKDLDDAGFRNLALVTDRGYDSLRNVERYIQRSQAMLMAVRVGQAFVMDRIRHFGAYESCPDAMSVDGETELAWFQCDLDYEVKATNGGSRKADRLKLNIYLDVRRRAEILLRLRIEIESQRKELVAMLGKTTLPGGDADGDSTKGARPKHSYGYYRVSCDPDTGVVKSFELDVAKVAKFRLLVLT